MKDKIMIQHNTIQESGKTLVSFSIQIEFLKLYSLL